MLRFIEPDWPAPPNVLALCTTRAGGTSRPPWASLNLGDHVGDDPGAVAANRALLYRALPAGTRVQWLSQVHGVEAVEAGTRDELPVADASWSRRAGLACAVLTADCLPVLFCSRAGDRVAAAHAGWRGLLQGVLARTVAAMDTDPRQLLAWLGPAIGPAAFEVGPEVREAFLAGAPAGARAAVADCFKLSGSRPDHWLADLYALARLRLQGLGVGSVSGGHFCTYSDPERFYSFRRDGATGRMASLVMRLPA